MKIQHESGFLAFDSDDIEIMILERRPGERDYKLFIKLNSDHSMYSIEVPLKKVLVAATFIEDFHDGKSDTPYLHLGDISRDAPAKDSSKSVGMH